MDPILGKMRQAILDKQSTEAIASNAAIAAFGLCNAVDNYSSNETTQYINKKNG